MGKENQTSSFRASGEIETWAGKVNLSTAKVRRINGISYWEVPDPYLQKAVKIFAKSSEPLDPATVVRYQRQTILIDQTHPLVQILHSDSSWLWRSQLPQEYQDAKASAGVRKFLERLLDRARKENKPDLAKQYEDELKKPGISPNSPLAWRNRRQRERLLPLEFHLARAAANRGKTRPDPIVTKTEVSSQPKKRKRADSPYSFDESLKRIRRRLKEERKT